MNFPKTISKHTIIQLLLCTMFSTNLLCMRMTQQGKQTTAKYLQQMKEQQMREREEKLKTAIVPFRSYTQSATINPLIFYEPNQKRMTLNFVENNRLKNSTISPTQVSFYNFSPQKKYLLFQTTSTGLEKTEPSLTEKLKTQAIEKVIGYKIGEKINSTSITKIIDLQSLTEIVSFDGELITYEFSPDETTLIIARRHLDKTHNNEGALPLGSRPQNDTTRYELLDIASKSVLKTFENVQTIDYLNEDNLVVQYDNGTIKQVAIQRNAWFSSTPYITETTDDKITLSKKITYYDATKELSITLAHGKKITEANVMAYVLSPLKNYLVMFKEKNAMYLINTRTGKKLGNVATNVITYCFSPDDKETRLVELGSPREFLTGQNILYSLVDLEKLSSSLTTFTIDNAFYFKSPNELVAISKNGTFTSYNPQTGVPFEKEQRQHKQQVMQEIEKMGQPQRRAEKLQEEQQQKAQKELEQRRRDIEEQEQDFKRRREYREQKEREQDIQKAYPVKEGSYYEQFKKYIWGNK